MRVLLSKEAGELVTGYEDEKFYINDPMCETGLRSGKTVIEGAVLEKAMASIRYSDGPRADSRVEGRRLNSFPARPWKVSDERRLVLP